MPSAAKPNLPIVTPTSLPQTSTSKLVARVAALRIARRGRLLLGALGLREPPAVARTELTRPDSALADEAATMLRELSPAYLVNHCERTYAFGVAVAKAMDKRFDHELLYVASALHDLGLTSAFDGAGPFELRGARAAHAFCLEQGVDDRHADRVYEAITMHTSLDAAQGEPEVALVHFGAAVDVVGFRWEDIAADTVEYVLEEWPRLDMKNRICAALAREAAKTPSSPMGVQFRLGFRKMIRDAPFDE